MDWISPIIAHRHSFNSVPICSNLILLQRPTTHLLQSCLVSHTKTEGVLSLTKVMLSLMTIFIEVTWNFRSDLTALLCHYMSPYLMPQLYIAQLVIKVRYYLFP